MGALSKGWKRRYFELTEDKINYYHFDEFEKTHKGFITIEEISEVAAKDPQVPGEKWWFFIDTPTRRYDLKSSEEYMMWKWIEGSFSLYSFHLILQ